MSMFTPLTSCALGRVLISDVAVGCVAVFPASRGRRLSISGSRYDLTDFESSVIMGVRPRKGHGASLVNDRRVLNGIFWVLRSGVPCRDMLKRSGPHTTVYNRFNRWWKSGVWDHRIMDAIIDACGGDVEMIDTSSVQVHQHAANHKKGLSNGCYMT